MTNKILLVALLAFGIMSCNSSSQRNQAEVEKTYADISIVGAMKNVMWNGELGSSINLDTIANKKGLYGLGPESYLRGELLINNGACYVSKVISDSTMLVEKRFDLTAPFFVYANVTEWSEVEIPATVKTIAQLKKLINEKTASLKRPFAFKLTGHVANAQIHIQNLPKGTMVSSPDEAHQGQVNYQLQNQECEIIGFFSTEHKGVFTHHDSFLHMHLIAKDESKMGHLDRLEIGNMKLLLPKS